MKLFRTIIWVLVAVGFLIFAIYNWQPVELTLWQNLVLETKVPVLAFLAFSAGFLPLFGYHLSVRWALGRRVRALENSLKNTALARRAERDPAPVVVPSDTLVDKPGINVGQTADPLSPANAADAAGDGE